MRALIVDDEPKARDILHLLLTHHAPTVTFIREADGAGEATRLLKEFSPDLVFLDIKMPGMDGFEWLKSLPERNFDVIFTTAYDQYAIRAIRYSAFDYLLKPVDPEDLTEALNRYHLDQSNASYENLFHNTDQSEAEDYRLTIVTTDGTHFLRPADIVRCEADGNYTHFYLDGNKHILASRSLGFFAGLLPEEIFLRCHKSHLVNRRFIDGYSDKQLILTDDSRIEVSRRRINVVKNAMMANGKESE